MAVAAVDAEALRLSLSALEAVQGGALAHMPADVQAGVAKHAYLGFFKLVASAGGSPGTVAVSKTGVAAPSFAPEALLGADVAQASRGGRRGRKAKSTATDDEDADGAGAGAGHQAEESSEYDDEERHAASSDGGGRRTGRKRKVSAAASSSAAADYADEDSDAEDDGSGGRSGMCVRSTSGSAQPRIENRFS